DDKIVPRGKYGFVELYCDEKDCDCRRVLIYVVEERTPKKVWATINFGWDPRGEWAKMEKHKVVPSGAFLDPINPQSEYAEKFLDLFKSMIANDSAYVERLKRHYALVKESLGPRGKSWERPDPERRARRPKPEVLSRRRKHR
ncbi:MAG: hypothetical protein ACP5XB_27780, partial [Isosphaeraceae bacterium]